MQSFARVRGTCCLSSTSSSTLFRIAGIGASLAFGAMVASLFALRSVRDGFTFAINTPAVLAFLAAGTFAWFYWRMIERMAANQAPEQRKKKFVVFSVG